MPPCAEPNQGPAWILLGFCLTLLFMLVWSVTDPHSCISVLTVLMKPEHCTRAHMLNTE